MTSSHERMDTTVRDLRDRSHAEGGLFWTPRGELAVFDPSAAQTANTTNFRDLTLPDRLVDLVRGRRSPRVSWRDVRAAWYPQLRRLSEPPSIAQLAQRMEALLDARLGRELDLVWAAQEVATYALLPTVIAGLSRDERARVQRDQAMKLERLLALRAEPESAWRSMQRVLVQVRAGRIVRRELARRARGKSPRQLDLTDPMVDMLPVLGMDRAAYAITTVLTAVSGPPGAVAACLLHAIAHHPTWAARLQAELAPLAPSAFYAAPARTAPVTHRFVKEALRMWSAPAILTRVARAPIDVGAFHLEPGQAFQVSPYIVHRDPKHWNDPDTFDPDRWSNEADHAGRYVPFGWSPTACIGAQLGTIQLALFAYLATTRYRIELASEAASTIVPSAVPLPIDFRGTIARRAM
ncbi:cytochrome P450 [Pendulispora albinea]|uniref:Cytochrome P450 n=1 Tax=Pendulispora albinea TaxID=2741071 RepID=A0ABZ2M8U0_9BACT